MEQAIFHAITLLPCSVDFPNESLGKNWQTGWNARPARLSPRETSVVNERALLKFHPQSSTCAGKDKREGKKKKMNNEEEIIKWTCGLPHIRKHVINIEMEFANFGPSRIVKLQRCGPPSQRHNFLRPMFSKKMSHFLFKFPLHVVSYAHHCTGCITSITIFSLCSYDFLKRNKTFEECYFGLVKLLSCPPNSLGVVVVVNSVRYTNRWIN